MFDDLQIGQVYERPQLARMWGLEGFQAISRGVFTPRGKDYIVLFVTHEKQLCLTQYEDFIQEDLLFWEGETGHRSDARIIAASECGDEIHLFYRQRHHSPFIYHGRIILLRHEPRINQPSKFTFEIISRAQVIPASVSEVAEEGAEYRAVSTHALSAIDRKIVARSRGIVQRIFRGNVLRLWDGSCAVTGVQEPRVLVAAHIKPWSEAVPQEKVDHYNGLLLVPNLDALFDQGLISFRDDGGVIISNLWSKDDQRRMYVTEDMHLRRVPQQSKGYLAYHRDQCFEQS
jgi:putative restriction endonuclease